MKVRCILGYVPLKLIGNIILPQMNMGFLEKICLLRVILFLVPPPPECGVGKSFFSFVKCNSKKEIVLGEVSEDISGWIITQEKHKTTKARANHQLKLH